MNAFTRSARMGHVMLAGSLGVAAISLYGQEAMPMKIAPEKMTKIGAVDARFASYNVEMVEVTGGRFWKPYRSGAQSADAPKPSVQQMANQQVGQNTSLFEYRPPIDLSNARLRKLAAALGPAYVRVSGSWANSTYFQDNDEPAMKEPPKGFGGVLTRAEWKGVVDFAKAVDARIVTSVAVSPGVRDASGAWTAAQARAFFEYTKSVGGNIYATEFMNEPNFPGPGGAPAGYDAERFGADIKAFAPFLRKQSPRTIFLGPSAIGEGVSMMPKGVPMAMQVKMLKTTDLMKAAPPVFDAFSYHFYGTVSHRCMGNLTVEQAMTPEWLNRTDGAEAFYAAIRDQYLPGKPMWLTETAEAACGGDELAGQFVDVFRYLNQLGTLAQKGVRVVMHNTLASSDYGLLAPETFDPRPDYWAALVWKHTMGSTVLDPGMPKGGPVRIFAQCKRGSNGGVTILALNTDEKSAHTITIPKAAERYTLTAAELNSTTVLLNGVELKAASDGTVPALHGEPVAAGKVQLVPASATFLTVPSAGNKSCGD